MNNDAHIEQRIARVEEQIASLTREYQESRQVQRQDMNELKQDIKTSSLSISRIELAVQLLSAQKPCPNPGACLAMEPRLDELEDTVKEVKAGWKTLTWVASTAAIVGSIISWLASHGVALLSAVKETPKP